MKIFDETVIPSIEKFNEAEVRFHIIDPIMRALGYPAKEGTYLKLEEKLAYPYYHIGHKSKKDLPLGFPDYRAGVKGRRGSFIVEAKAVGQKLSKNDIEQAHSYAAHAMVGANYFVLCDGVKFQIFETLSGPKHSPIVDLAITSIENLFFKIENILSPNSLLRNCQVVHDDKLKLSDGVASSVKVMSGQYDVTKIGYRYLQGGEDVTEIARASVPQISELDNLIKQLVEFQYTIERGIVERNGEGRITCDLKFGSITKNNAVNMKLVGLDRMVFMSADKFVSTNPQNPTLFEAEAGFELSKGTPLFPLFGDAIPIEQNMEADVFMSASLYFMGTGFCGNYFAYAVYTMSDPVWGEIEFELKMIGNIKGEFI